MSASWARAAAHASVRGGGQSGDTYWVRQVWGGGCHSGVGVRSRCVHTSLSLSITLSVYLSAPACVCSVTSFRGLGSEGEGGGQVYSHRFPFCWSFF